MEYDQKSDHYSVGGIETIDFLKAKLTQEEYRGFCKGNVLKYMSRIKDPKRDAEKARYYAWWLAESFSDENKRKYVRDYANCGEKTDIINDLTQFKVWE